MQEFTANVGIVPVVYQRNACPVGQDKRRNVDCIGGGVLTQRRPTADGAAVVAAEIFKRDDLLPEMLLRQRWTTSRFQSAMAMVTAQPGAALAGRIVGTKRLPVSTIRWLARQAPTPTTGRRSYPAPARSRAA